MKVQRYLFYFALFNIFLAVPPWIAEHYYPGAGILIPRFWNLFAVFAILNLIVYLLASWGMSFSHRSSGRALLASISVKLFLYMVIAFVYISSNQVGAANFMLCFFYLYLFHTVFEIYCLLCNLRNQNNK